MTGTDPIDFTTALPEAPKGGLAQNIIYFARSLRRAGLSVGPAQVQSATEAIARVGFTKRADFRTALRTCFVTRAEDLSVFHQCFDLFWRDPDVIGTMMQAMLPMLTRDTPPPPPKSAERRAREAMMEDLGRSQAPPKQREEIELDSRMSFSTLEKLGAQDFEQMSAEEMTQAEAAIKSLHLPIRPRPSRALAPAPRGQIDPRAVLAQARRRGGEIFTLPRRAPKPRPPRLVILTDISGSMSSYSRMILLFAHALMVSRRKFYSDLHVFTFGTRLTNITRKLALKDPDHALAAIGQIVQDWDGGTAIGENLTRFHKDWARRVLGTDTILILISDGLERGDSAQLSKAAERLSLCTRRFLWMNPLLRFDGFSPEAGGIKALLPHVDQLLGAHNLDSFADLAEILSAPSQFHTNPAA